MSIIAMQKIARAFFAIFFDPFSPVPWSLEQPGTGFANSGRFEKSPEENAMIGYWFDVVLVTLNTSQWVDASKNQNESCLVEVAAGAKFLPSKSRKMREIVHLQAGQCGNQIGAKVRGNQLSSM